MRLSSKFQLFSIFFIAFLIAHFQIVYGEKVPTLFNIDKISLYSDRDPSSPLKLAMDKSRVNPGENITIIVKNQGNKTMLFINSILGLRIKNVETNERIFPDIVYLPTITNLTAGQTAIFTFPTKDIQGNTVKPGNYSAEITSLPLATAPRASANATFSITNDCVPDKPST
jgi:hypothetical protein